MLTASLNAAAATHGIVDPLLGRQVVAAGYDAWPGQQSGIGPRPDARWRSIEIGPTPRPSVRIPGQRSGRPRAREGMARPTGHHRPQVSWLRRDREHGGDPRRESGAICWG